MAKLMGDFIRNFVLYFIAAAFLTGCATVSRGTSDKLIIDTEPAGALVTTDLERPKSKFARRKDPSLPARYFGCPATPCEIKMRRRSEMILTISHKGYEPVEIGIDSGLSKESLNEGFPKQNGCRGHGRW